jgi:hypothetical protein
MDGSRSMSCLSWKASSCPTSCPTWSDIDRPFPRTGIRDEAATPSAEAFHMPTTYSRVTSGSQCPASAQPVSKVDTYPRGGVGESRYKEHWMKAKSFVTCAAVTAGIGAAVLGLGAAPAMAQPGGPGPGPGWHEPPPPPPPGGPGGPGWPGPPGGPPPPPPPPNWGPPPPPDWGPPEGPGWRGHRPPWGDGPAPWGWGPPPPPPPHGPLPPPWGPPPPPFDYWGHRVTPIFDPGFHAWGFWFFGLWIPL